MAEDLDRPLRRKVTLTGYTCKRCAYEWVPRDQAKVPTVCAGCRSPYWRITPRRARKSAIKSAARARPK